MHALEIAINQFFHAHQTLATSTAKKTVRYILAKLQDVRRRRPTHNPHSTQANMRTRMHACLQEMRHNFFFLSNGLVCIPPLHIHTLHTIVCWYWKHFVCGHSASACLLQNYWSVSAKRHTHAHIHMYGLIYFSKFSIHPLWCPLNSTHPQLHICNKTIKFNVKHARASVIHQKRGLECGRMRARAYRNMLKAHGRSNISCICRPTTHIQINNETFVVFIGIAAAHHK